MSRTPYFRFRWSHVSRSHRAAVRIYNACMRFVPFSVKYGIGKKLREKKPPYCFITPGAVVLQVGAPRDILSAGRSRGMYFSLFVGNTGKTIILEPDSESIRYFQVVCQQRGIGNIICCQTGAWSEKTTLRFLVNDSHPASNLTEEAAKRVYSKQRLQDFRVVEIPVDTIDNILRHHQIDRLDLVSITTNGSEREILQGMRGIIAKGLPYIALAGTGNNYIEFMQRLGYTLQAYDDRGCTFRQNS